MIKLYKHQLAVLSNDPAYAGLFLGTGSGKTRLALCLAKGATLVICPKTQKEDRNWERENDQSKLGVDLIVMSKEEFRRDAGKLRTFDTVIVDEAHTALGATPYVRYVKRQAIPKTSQIYEALEAYVARTAPKRFYLCTATIMRSPMTVWAAGRLLGRSWDFYAFRNAYYVRLPMPGREVWRPKTDDETKDRLAKCVRGLGYTGRLDTFFDVPVQTFRTIHIELTEKQKKRIKDMTTEYPEPIVRVGKIHQIENGVLSGDEFNKPESFENGKIERLLELSDEFSRMVVFAKYKAQIAQIASALRDKGKKVLILVGETKERGNVIVDANTSPDCVLIVQAQISSGWQVGKTDEHPEYFDYNCMVFASMDYSVINRIQGEGRILRSDNLKKNLYINLTVKGGVDEAVERCIANKQDFDERIYLKK